MADFDAMEYFKRVDNSQNPADVDAAFDEIGKLPADEQKKAVDTIEKQFVDYFKNTGPSPAELAQIKLVMNLLEQAKNTPQAQFLMASIEGQASLDLLEGQTMSQVFLNIHKVKGEGSDPVVKAYVELAAKMSDEDYNSAFGQMKLMVDVADKISQANKPPAQKNPFRRGGPSAP